MQFHNIQKNVQKMILKHPCVSFSILIWANTHVHPPLCAGFCSVIRSEQWKCHWVCFNWVMSLHWGFIGLWSQRSVFCVTNQKRKVTINEKIVYKLFYLLLISSLLFSSSLSLSLSLAPNSLHIWWPLAPLCLCCGSIGHMLTALCPV